MWFIPTPDDDEQLDPEAEGILALIGVGPGPRESLTPDQRALREEMQALLDKDLEVYGDAVSV